MGESRIKGSGRRNKVMWEKKVGHEKEQDFHCLEGFSLLRENDSYENIFIDEQKRII